MLTAALLAVLVLILTARRAPAPEARTIAQIWQAVRAHGWKAPLLAAGGVTVALALAGCALLVVLCGVALKVLEAAALLVACLGWHICDLIDWHPVTLREAS
ncbi:hypothetical protein N5079_19915 [Planotetraspora sp. A-T 1434]|uniref:hypothetical protein n=1 Tax=Planotetraspora sp. A-T 1434 TaxID=2979219 RepID=UPI0021BE17B4|nr:hypothetical protein [Planotetraspora sp. A-T 1434]MCT9932472.1 hypothetical protein [Planotetraspora sp. A-T 1434]